MRHSVQVKLREVKYGKSRTHWTICTEFHPNRSRNTEDNDTNLCTELRSKTGTEIICHHPHTGFPAFCTNFYKEFRESSTKGFACDTNSETDAYRHDLNTLHSLLIRKEQLKSRASFFSALLFGALCKT
jgi:hypothetical protein